MREVIVDTSVVQYLHQLGLLDLLRTSYGTVLVPEAVAVEIETGRARGIDLPDVRSLEWIRVSIVPGDLFSAVTVELGAGEREVIALASASPGSLALLDDRLAREHARELGVAITGTLGVLLRAKQVGAIASLAPVLDRLDALRFRIDPETRRAVLRLAGE
jgi:predicted nucleic acid-binding protein